MWSEQYRNDGGRGRAFAPGAKITGPPLLPSIPFSPLPPPLTFSSQHFLLAAVCMPCVCVSLPRETDRLQVAGRMLEDLEQGGKEGWQGGEGERQGGEGDVCVCV